jgi:purine-binding chemotaxis protein CheW
MSRDEQTRLLVFRVGAERFAMALDAVHEVIDPPPVQRVPDAPPTVVGVAALRGTYVTIHDARALLGISGPEPASVLLLAEGDRRVGLAVSDVEDAMSIEPSELRPVPGVADAMLAGLVRRGAELTVVLNAHALLVTVASTMENEPT